MVFQKSTLHTEIFLIWLFNQEYNAFMFFEEWLEFSDSNLGHLQDKYIYIYVYITHIYNMYVFYFRYKKAFPLFKIN